MSEEAKARDNIERLLKHLKPGSLAEQLVKTVRDAEAGSPTETMKAVISNRLQEVRSELVGTQD